MSFKDLQNEEEIDDDPLIILKAILLQVEREFKLHVCVCVYFRYAHIRAHARTATGTSQSLIPLGLPLYLLL